MTKRTRLRHGTAGQPLPIFDGSACQASVDHTYAAYAQECRQLYQQTVLRAFKEVEDNLHLRLFDDPPQDETLSSARLPQIQYREGSNITAPDRSVLQQHGWLSNSMQNWRGS